jgi:hypothetical protein
MGLGSGIRHPGFEIRDPKKHFPDPGSGGQKGTRSRERIRKSGKDGSEKAATKLKNVLENYCKLKSIQHLEGNCMISLPTYLSLHSC